MKTRPLRIAIAALLSAAFSALTVVAVAADTPPMTPDIPPNFVVPKPGYDFEKRVVMIPMRDGVKLNTVIYVPKGAKNAPILLSRTPYNAAKRVREDGASLLALLQPEDEVFVGAGYIRVVQDVRGKHGSEGEYVMTRPLRGALNSSDVDHSTDAYDTIDYLVKNLPESNGKVGMIGSSYDGFTVVMALINPHPALKVACPESPMIDGWMGDDWFHYGAFRQTNLDYFAGQTEVRGEGKSIARQTSDDYENFRRAGSAGDYAKAAGLDQLPFWHKVSEHPAYDRYWQEQALDKIMAHQPLTVPTMWLQGLWDQEDMWGAIHAYAATEPKDNNNDRNYLVMGPWRHSGVKGDGSFLGPLKFEGDTALQFRRDVLLPFFNQYLKDGAPKADTPPVLIYNTGENRWERFKSWPVACDAHCEYKPKSIYLAAHGSLSFDAPAEAQSAAFDEYVSDPAKPVPYVPRPLRFDDRAGWQQWLVTDQRAFVDRTDVLSYETEPLTASIKISGAPKVNLVASTSETDSDWVVKLIDVYPDKVPSQPAMGGYELAVGMDIFRGRYRENFSDPKAIESNKPLPYQFALPTANHTFLPGHRIMVQIQSSWFPLYDRNPQTFVPNIFFAQPKDYVKATQRVYRARDAASFISLPIVPATN